jgi:transposase
MTWTGFPRHLLQLLQDDTALKGFLVGNYRIHNSTIVTPVLGDYLAGKIVVHFFPPYCPDDNRIERVWQDLHANVTQNHR